MASGQLRRAAKHFGTSVIANWNPRAAYFSRTPWDNVTDLPPHFYGCYTRDAFDPEVSWAAMAPRARNGVMHGNPFGPPVEGPDRLVLFEVPRKETGIPSIGYLLRVLRGAVEHLARGSTREADRLVDRTGRVNRGTR